MSNRSVEINGDRLLRELHQLANFGAQGKGVNRPAFSAADMSARQWLATRFAEAGLVPFVDRFGTVLGRDARPGRAFLVGSHTDSVPMGGWLDGALGVMYGLEIARSFATLSDAPIVDVIDFQDEEGSSYQCLGSRAFCGELEAIALESVKTFDGRSLMDVIRDEGSLNKPVLRLEPGRYYGYLEAHIEQGPRLEHEHCKIGVVSAIVGIRRLQITCSGRADHAGTTPMNMRRDAGAAAIGIADAILKRLPALADRETVWNIGTINFAPNAVNVVPARASFSLQFRDASVDILNRIDGEVRAIARHTHDATGCPVNVEEGGRLEPTPLNRGLNEITAAICEEAGLPFLRLTSGAGHDAILLARHVPSAMLFVPSIGGRSHDPAEDTAEDDIVIGCQVLADVIFRAAANNGWSR